MKQIFPPACASRVYVNFPDPWFKRRHHVRRMVDSVLAEQIAYVLAPGGELFVQTDVWDIAIDAMSAFDGDALREPRRRVDVLEARQSVRRAVVARAERRRDRTADLAPLYRH